MHIGIKMRLSEKKNHGLESKKQNLNKEAILSIQAYQTPWFTSNMSAGTFFF